MLRRDRSFYLLIPFLLVCLLATLRAYAVDPQADAAAQVLATHSFLTALACKDMATCRTFLPSSSKALFGPYPFVGIPMLSHPFVSGDQAMADWEGQPVNAALPTHGTLLFRKPDGKSVWKVRQICYYSEMPILLKKSVRSLCETSADRQAKSELVALGDLFLRAWADGRYEDVRANWYDWSQVNRRFEIKYHIDITETTRCTSAPGEAVLKVAFVPQVPFFHRTYHGTLTLVQEENTWKVRGSYLEFYTSEHGPHPVPPGTVDHAAQQTIELENK